jgi:hypothetical protein
MLFDHATTHHQSKRQAKSLASEVQQLVAPFFAAKPQPTSYDFCGVCITTES